VITFEGRGAGSFSSLYGFVYIAICMGIALFMPNTQQYLGTSPGERVRLPSAATLTGWLQWAPGRLHGAIAGVMMFAVMVKSLSAQVSEFLYFQF
jgi:hypothetical protein